MTQKQKYIAILNMAYLLQDDANKNIENMTDDEYMYIMTLSRINANKNISKLFDTNIIAINATDFMSINDFEQLQNKTHEFIDIEVI